LGGRCRSISGVGRRLSIEERRSTAHSPSWEAAAERGIGRRTHHEDDRNRNRASPVASSKEWLAERKKLLAHEKELTERRDRVNAERRRLPMVKIEKEYTFEGPQRKQSLRDLFDGRRQLIVYHFMFDPKWDQGCPGCTGYVDSLGDLSMRHDRDTTFVLISRAPLAKLEAYKATKGWDDVFHTYSAYARGVENLTNSYSLLDTTPYGRQEDFEDSPPGWPQRPTYG
jgi:predicted dithiol-disulfide oxidoreductase (DUF899 family)